ncbi:MAG: hypothetical protein AVO39_00350 [delta proteobacterium MLS_D]|jgi:sugar lactone lactonase YvrE|nr:MAG: hypothetical protein AVO39_00350 [delta proteobacterium MLS_D]
MKRLLILTVKILVIILVLYIFAYPPPIDPESFQPERPPSAMVGPSKNTPSDTELLHDVAVLAVGKLSEPRYTTEGRDGLIYTGLRDGRIVRVTPVGGAVQDFAVTDGRPMGLAFSPAGPWKDHLMVADAVRGLLAVAPTGAVYVLTTKDDNRGFGFLVDLAISDDGTVYVTDASFRHDPDRYLHEILEARPNGRLLQYNPSRGTTVTLLDNLYFPTGVLLAPDESYVLVSETGRYRITRYWLRGPRAGSSDIFLNDLPGFPCGLSRGKDTTWIAVASARNAAVDWLHPNSFLKGIVSKVPVSLWPKMKAGGFVVAIRENSDKGGPHGNISLILPNDTEQHLRGITSVNEFRGKLYLGTLHGDGIGVLDLDR